MTGETWHLCASSPWPPALSQPLPSVLPGALTLGTNESRGRKAQAAGNTEVGAETNLSLGRMCMREILKKIQQILVNNGIWVAAR